MTFKHLRVFKMVCEKGSMTSAAKALYISQPSVSQVIIDLEKKFKMKLFNKSGKKLVITEAGSVLLEHANSILRDLHMLEDGMKLENQSKEIEIKLAASLTVGNTFLPKLLSDFSKQYSNYMVKSIVGNVELVTGLLNRGEIDLAVIASDKPIDTDAERVRFYEDKLSIICHRNHSLADKKYVTLDEVRKYPFIVREKGSSIRGATDDIINPNIIGEFHDTESILNGVEHDIGISCVPRIYKFGKTYHNVKFIDAVFLDTCRGYYIYFAKKGEDYQHEIQTFANYILNYKY